jgi:hypothetical protein
LENQTASFLLPTPKHRARQGGQISDFGTYDLRMGGVWFAS